MSQQQPQRVLLLDPSEQVGFSDDLDPFALPSRNPNLGLKSRNKNHYNNNNNNNTTTTTTTTTNTSSKPEVSVSFGTSPSQYQYNTYQHDDLYGDDDSNNSPGNIKSNNNPSKGNKKDQQQSGAEFSFKPQSKYDMKNHMANERTFFKYLFTGLHIGSIGTLVLTFFPNDDIHKLYLVIIIWLIAFAFMFWGLYGYYKRKNLMESGKLNETNEISPHTPLLISSIFVGVILSVVWYGLFVHYKYENGISISKLLMMSEKETGGSRKKRGNRNRNRRNGGGGRKKAQQAANADSSATNHDGNDDGKSIKTIKTIKTVKEKNDREVNEAAGFYNGSNGQIIEPSKLDTDNDVKIDDKMDIIGFEKEGKQEKGGNSDGEVKTEFASVLPTLQTDDKSTSTTPKKPNRLHRIINEPLPDGVVKIPQTSEDGGDFEVDTNEHSIGEEEYSYHHGDYDSYDFEHEDEETNDDDRQ